MTPLRRTYNILIVEDNPGDANLIREAFRECGQSCELVFAESTGAAQQLLGEGSFDMMLSDLGLRDGETEQFIHGIRADPRLRTLPIIVVSGAPDPLPAYEAGANAFIAKTLDMDEFFLKIRALMHFWVEVAELPPARPGI